MKKRAKRWSYAGFGSQRVMGKHSFIKISATVFRSSNKETETEYCHIAPNSFKMSDVRDGKFRRRFGRADESASNFAGALFDLLQRGSYS